MRIIICGLWKEPERDYMNDIISWLLWISEVSRHSECAGTLGTRACEGDFPFLLKYKRKLYARGVN